MSWEALVVVIRGWLLILLGDVVLRVDDLLGLLNEGLDLAHLPLQGGLVDTLAPLLLLLLLLKAHYTLQHPLLLLKHLLLVPLVLPWRLLLRLLLSVLFLLLLLFLFLFLLFLAVHAPVFFVFLDLGLGVLLKGLPLNAGGVEG